MDPEPYQEPDPSESVASEARWKSHHAHDDGDGSDLSPKAKKPKVIEKKQQHQKKRKSWHLRRKIAKVSKLEIDDAFEMRGRVIVAMLVSWGIVIYAIWMAVAGVVALARG